MTPHGGGYAAAGHLRAAPRLRGRPSGLNGRCRDRCATGPRPALDPGASTAPEAGNTGRPKPAPPEARSPPRGEPPTANPHPH